MNAGFSNLTALKAQLLAQSLRARTDFDVQLAALGLGVAGLIGGYCNRSFARVAGDTLIIPGNTRLINLPRYPVEALTAVDFKTRLTSDWTDGLGSVYSWNAAAGLVDLSNYLTDHHGQVRVTYTAGFFWETKEPTDGGYPTTVPTGAALLPDAIRTAWHLQCETLWRGMDKLGTQIAKEPASAGVSLSSNDLNPTVKAMLADHIRFSP